MPVSIRFDKQRAEYLFLCMHSGRSIEPADPQGWTIFEMLMTAGTLVFAACTSPDHEGEPHKQEDVMAAIQAVARMAESVFTDTYDAEFEAEVTATVSKPTDKDKTGVNISFLSGRKGPTTGDTT